MIEKKAIEYGTKWFHSQNWKVYPFQKKMWQSFFRESSGILNAPTGSGKTFSLWIPAAIRAAESKSHQSRQRLKIIWLTPLRALANDLTLAMQRFSDENELGLKISIRTGDTSTNERQRINQSPPDCLVTTPESLHLMLSQKDSANYFSDLETLVVDEWHELLGTKRGVQVELAISRLKALTDQTLSVWGISATVGNMDEALQVLTGVQEKGVIVRADIKKKIQIKSVIPKKIENYPWAGHLGIRLIKQVMDIVHANNTTLLFTNTRSQTEIWYQGIMEKYPEMAGLMAMHHGSIDNDIRKWVEDALNEGKLKLVICTSSLDLGVDFRPVDMVIQVGSPKGVSRFFQRAGRSGHGPGEVSRLQFVPTHALELIEAAALRSAIDDGQFEPRKPQTQCIDVLVQYLVTLAVGGGFYPDEIFEQVKQTYAFNGLTEQEWKWCLTFITTGGESLSQYEEFSKVEIDKGLYKVFRQKTMMRHRLGIGTIVGDPALKVRFVTGGFIGTVEESFVSRLNPGDVFWFAGQPLEFVRLKDLTVQVKKGSPKKGTVPRWGGGRIPLSSELSRLLRSKIESAAREEYDSVELKKIKPILDLQAKLSIIPDKNTLLIEKTQSDEGYHVFVFPFEGRAVHEVLGAVVAFRIAQSVPITLSISMNDYGFELLSDQAIPIEEALESDLFTKKDLLFDISHSVNQSEMAKRRFRDIAAISGLVFQGHPGQPVRGKHLQMNSGIIYQALADYDPDNLLLKQAEDEVLSRQLELDRFMEAMDRINQQEIRLVQTKQPTPFSFPILVDGMRERISSESLASRIERMKLKME
ncbi:ligase-associated DNA damage response DEXH box helicase [Reichenbachiella ulvae]|uniref:Ligase-associated DNA damage response DEXH box helicase n=1 Tax=Reichenbachiella ulvae TaxID=2980104 RepID=A0ABT3CYK9_9BACT|nr:ligase-associated DNA damage response DEXH box helicase [Reichenbachiella ulvae]MCV9388742.1 ligase-associated DNA damage response DEXH box helicase [Reichenbachiella ulvae]